MLNITYYYRNANQNYNVVSPYTGENGHHQKKKKKLQTINAEEDVEKWESSCTVGGNVNCYCHYGEQYGDSSQSRNKTTIGLSNPTIGHKP